MPQQSDGPQPDKSPRRRAAYALLWVYKHGPSQLFYAFGARCRHDPSCSEYGAECVARHGWWAGGWMALARFLRCRPGGSWGHDPAPETLPDVPFWQPWRYADWRGPQRLKGGDAVEKRPEA